MKKVLFLFWVLFLLAIQSQAENWKGKWIATKENAQPNSWFAYRKSVNLAGIPATVPAKIAVDSKYWLWINEKLVVFEGGLKRGPNPKDTYYDQIDIAPYLKSGSNTIAVLVWHFGKDGFSHKNSGKAGLLFDAQAKDFQILSDHTWKCALLPSYKTAGAPHPNYRLPESSILYDANLEIGNWKAEKFNESQLPDAVELGQAGVEPWNQLTLRPIPQWKNYGLKNYTNASDLPKVSTGDTIVCDLPYNAQITPFMRIEGPKGSKITICTDNYTTYNGGEPYLRAEYISKEGLQEYENLGWVNGHKVYYVIPKGFKIHQLKYRETGYHTDFAGSFTSSDPFLNKLWEKAKRTLYITMRDNYMDCPDRERAQWTGDAVIESGEAFYALSPSSHSLAKKWLHEIVQWQRKDGSLFSPVPAGNWNQELACQSTATVGEYGIWNYYLHTGDKETVANLYDRIKQYLDLWEKDDKGTMKFRRGEWVWGDWGNNRDTVLIYNSWYYLAAKGMQKMAMELGKKEDAAQYQTFMTTFKESFNKQFWNGKAYRHPSYQGKTDDRVQALAVLAGLADKEKYPAILEIFQTEVHASPYMEKYVFEAMFLMGYENEAIARHTRRFSPMVNNPYFTTLFEGWGVGKEGFGGGTVNHAWSGGGLTVLSQYLCGISPAEVAYKTVKIAPQPGPVKNASATIASVKGTISSTFTNTSKLFTLLAEIPTGSKGLLGVPAGNYSEIYVDNKLVWKDGKRVKNSTSEFSESGQHYLFSVPSGKSTVRAVKK